MKPEEIQFAHNLKALAAPQCRRIVEALVQDSQTRTDLTKICKLTPASIDKHLDILVQAGLVKIRTIDGSKKAYLQAYILKPTIDWFNSLNS